MSAAEKLKVLERSQAYIVRDELERVLPQIVAVVEAAQTTQHEYDLWAEDANDGEFAIWSRDDFMAAFLVQRRALSALESALA